MPEIRVLEVEPNKRGDLFGRLLVDLFLALGYEHPRCNIHKSGREIDIEVEHRTEKRWAVAECKAETAKSGGADINKFVGALDAERRKHSPTETVGYFVSLAGFTETAVEQEREAGNQRVILIDSQKVISELVDGHVIVSLHKAMETAGRCIAKENRALVVEDNGELAAHAHGWVWIVYFAKNKERTHFALIHADGYALSANLAKDIIYADKLVDGTLSDLTYLPPQEKEETADVSTARTKYFEYLASECGEIQLEGLPTDEEVGSRRLHLEKLFVPLFLNTYNSEEAEKPLEQNVGEAQRRKSRESVGYVLQEHNRLAILAAPGGGKSTLLKRLAIAYAFPERRLEINDSLPDRSWFPLFIRCRHLNNLVRSPISEIVDALADRAEISQLKQAFMLFVKQQLQIGDILLLIDGLDEISDEGDRIAFVHQLRIFLATYPKVSLVLTSRVAGFRIVGGALSSQCRHYVLSDFDFDDIQRLTLAWHKVVVGDKPEVREEAEALALTIYQNNRVRLLAQNPLLLTTLLLVKRWVGQLPNKRSLLYGRAIEVLLMTWNVAAHSPLDQDEAIPQLAFVAYTMMSEGIQKVSRKRLQDILFLARKQMPEVLGYARLGVSEFIERVELRSSLLTQTGYNVEDGTLYPIYEFQHLTFQEYLAAKAVVEGYYPNRREEDNPLELLRDRFEDERWKEVIPLTAVLSGRNAQPIVEYLLPRTNTGTSSDMYLLELIAQCLLDEVQISPALLEKALELLARNYDADATDFHLLSIMRGKYGSTLYKVITDAFRSASGDLFTLGSALKNVVIDELKWKYDSTMSSEKLEDILRFLSDTDLLTKAKGALLCMNILYDYYTYTADFEDEYDQPRYLIDLSADEERGKLATIEDKLVALIDEQEEYVKFAGLWAINWLQENSLQSRKHTRHLLTDVTQTF